MAGMGPGTVQPWGLALYEALFAPGSPTYTHTSAAAGAPGPFPPAAHH